MLSIKPNFSKSKKQKKNQVLRWYIYKYQIYELSRSQNPHDNFTKVGGGICQKLFLFFHWKTVSFRHLNSKHYYNLLMAHLKHSTKNAHQAPPLSLIHWLLHQWCVSFKVASYWLTYCNWICMLYCDPWCMSFLTKRVGKNNTVHPFSFFLFFFFFSLYFTTWRYCLFSQYFASIIALKRKEKTQIIALRNIPYD